MRLPSQFALCIYRLRANIISPAVKYVRILGKHASGYHGIFDFLRVKRANRTLNANYTHTVYLHII